MYVYLVVALFSSSDVLLSEPMTMRECALRAESFEKEHQGDRDIKSVDCRTGIVLSEND
jgi:hypothetical protein